MFTVLLGKPRERRQLCLSSRCKKPLSVAPAHHLTLLSSLYCHSSPGSQLPFTVKDQGIEPRDMRSPERMDKDRCPLVRTPDGMCKGPCGLFLKKTCVCPWTKDWRALHSGMCSYWQSKSQDFENRLISSWLNTFFFPSSSSSKKYFPKSFFSEKRKHDCDKKGLLKYMQVCSMQGVR